MEREWSRKLMLGSVITGLVAGSLACDDSPDPAQVTQNLDPRLGGHLFAACPSP